MLLAENRDWIVRRLSSHIVVCPKSDRYELSANRITIQAYAFRTTRFSLTWLDEWPVGIKLNHELGKFLGDAFLWFLTVWENGTRPFGPFLKIKRR